MKMFLVGRYELLHLLRKPGFLILAFGLPLLGVAVLAALTLRGSEPEASAVQSPTTPGMEAEGYVDLAGIIREIPEDVPARILRPFGSERAARRALQVGEIGAYYVVAQDYLDSGEVQYVHPTVNPLSSQGQDWLMRRTLVYNLVGGDPRLLEEIWDPIGTESVDLSMAAEGATGDCTRPNANCEANEVVGLMPTMLLIFLFVALTNGSSLLMRNVSLEKQNRMIEILTSSLSPLQIMAGKIAGLGVATLLAFGAWLLSAGLAIRMGDTADYFPAGFAIPSELVPWAVVFFLLGFTLYGSLSAGIGALVPNLKESTQATWLIMAPILLGYLIGIFGVETPHSPLMIALSLFPFSSPMVMVQRLSVGGVPGWQPFAAAAILAVSVLLAVGAASRLFRANHLLSGQHFTVRRTLQALVD